MLYAKVVFSLAVSGPFDYSVPEPMQKRIKIGSRVRVSFRTQKMVGYCVGLSKITSIKKVKSIIELIDDYPVLSNQLVLLTKKISEYYCCSWGEAIDTALPVSLREGRAVLPTPVVPTEALSGKGCVSPLVIQCIDARRRWHKYLEEIKIAFYNKKSTIVLLPDIHTVLKIKKLIEESIGVEVNLLFRRQKGELIAWAKIRSMPHAIVVGTRSAVFAPVNNLGLIIIESEEDTVYKQDNSPHYHAREVAVFRTKIENAKLVLGSAAVSSETFYYAKRTKAEFISVPIPKDSPEIKMIDSRYMSGYAQKKGLTGLQYLGDIMFSNITSREKTLLFINRRGFATLASCFNCGIILKCPRCNINLAYHYKNKVLNCHYCNYKIDSPKICPNCNSGYIRYSGAGAERIESDLQRVFPQAKIAVIDSSVDKQFPEADIYIATKSVIRLAESKFALTAVLGLDNTLNRPDFRSAEKTNSLLFSLLGLTEKKMIIETAFAGHHVFEAIRNKDEELFYLRELKERKSLSFPPYKHFCLVKLRGKIEEKVKKTSVDLFNFLIKKNKTAGIHVISVNPSFVPKLREYYYWQILLSAETAESVAKFLRINLKDFLHSGIIVTVDVDPV